MSWTISGGSGKEAYDGAGRRVAHQTTSGVASTTTYYVWSLEEVDGASGAVTKYYPTPAGVPAALRVGTNPVTYLATDGLGSVSEALDGSGNVTAAQLFGPYGQTRSTTGAMPTTKGYTGQRADAALGLDYYGARYYDPATDQFVSADTANAGLNRYAYVAGNPETATDPTGHRIACGPDDGCGSGSNGGTGALTPCQAAGFCKTPGVCYQPPCLPSTGPTSPSTGPKSPGKGPSTPGTGGDSGTPRTCGDNLTQCTGIPEAYAPPYQRQCKESLCASGDDPNSLFALLGAFGNATSLIAHGLKGLQELLTYLGLLKTSVDTVLQKGIDDDNRLALIELAANFLGLEGVGALLSIGETADALRLQDEKDSFDLMITVFTAEITHATNVLTDHPEWGNTDFVVTATSTGPQEYDQQLNVLAYPTTS